MCSRRGRLNSFFADGMRFQCIEGCVRCCKIPGKVFVGEDEIPRMAEFFGMTEEEVKSKHLKHFWGDIFELNYPEDKPCVFLGETGCLIYEARPTQCRTFPFWPDSISSPESWAHVVSLCPGVGNGKLYSPEEMERIADQIRKNPFI